MSEVGGENEGVPMSSASSISNDFPSEPPAMMSETEDSTSFSIEPSSSETDSYFGTGSRVKDDGSRQSSCSEVTSGSAPKEAMSDGTSSKNFPVRPGITWRKGERLEAMDYLQKWYPAKIMEIDEEEKSVLIHFEGWNQRYDEWVEMDSDCLRPLTRHSERRDKSKKEKTVYKVGDQVLAKWTDCKMYLAKIDEVLNDGSYVVLFYDGFKKTIQPINLRPVPSDLKQQKFQIKPPVLSPKDLKKLKNKPVDFTDTSTPGPSESQPAVKAPRALLHPHLHPAAHKKRRLIISGSLFARKDKAEKAEVPATATKSPKKSKDILKVKVKQEVKVEAPAVTEEKAPGTEASCQTEVTTSTDSPAKKKKRAGSFPPAVAKGKKLGRACKLGKLQAAPAVVKKAKSADEGKVLEPPVSAPPPTPPVPPVPVLPGVPPKAFVVEEDHNPYKCTMPGCNKGFRKAGLLASHVKYYHTDSGAQPATPGVPRKRKKTLSTCSTDSDISVSSRSTSTKRRRHISEVTLTGSPTVAMRMSFDEESPNNPTRPELPTVEETSPVDAEEEMSEEVVNCICGLREENGLMIQCDACLCWQHTQCFNITDDDLASNSAYICFICKHPPGVRDSCRYLYELDWFRKGRLPTFSFLNLVPSEKRQREVKMSHDLAGEVLKVQQVMHGLREEIALTGEKDHPEFRLWHNKPAKEIKSVAVSTSDVDTDGTDSEAKSTEDSGVSHGQVAMTTVSTVHTSEGTVSAAAETATQQQTQACGSKSEVTGPQVGVSSSSDGALSVGDKQPGGKLEHPTDTDSAHISAASSQGAGASDTPSCNGPIVNGKIKTEDRDMKQELVQTGVSQGSARQTGSEPELGKPSAGETKTEGLNLRTVPTTAKEESAGSIGHPEKGADLKPKAEIKTEPRSDDQTDLGSVETVQKDPFADCKMSVLNYVHQVQDDLSLALDALEVQIAALERQEFGEEVAGSYGNIPTLKHSLYRIARDLNKVKGIAFYR